MKSKHQVRTIVIIFSLLAIGAVFNILVNYASNSVPDLFKNHPYLIWLGILVCIIITLALTYIQEFSSSKMNFGKIQTKTAAINTPRFIPNLYDIFISYSSNDSEWVHNTLKEALSNHGFKVLTDKEFKGGSMSIEEMARAIENTRHTVAVMTPSFFNSDWTKLETAMVQTLDPGAAERKLVPILKEQCNIPLRLKVLHHRDLRTDQEWDQLIEDLM